MNRYQYDQHKVGFYYNTDPACRAKHELDQDKKYLVFFNGFNSMPTPVEVYEGVYLDLQSLMYTLNLSIVKGTPRWSQRAYRLYTQH